MNTLATAKAAERGRCWERDSLEAEEKQAQRETGLEDDVETEARLHA